MLEVLNGSCNSGTGATQRSFHVLRPAAHLASKGRTHSEVWRETRFEATREDDRLPHENEGFIC